MHAMVLVVFAMAGALALGGSTPARAATPQADAVREAIAQSVADRLGGQARVAVTGLQTVVRHPGPLTASPEPGARTGAAARFVLFAGGSRIGTAVATAQVTAVHVRARRAIARGEALTADDLEETDAELHGEPMRRLPALAELVGARTRRNLAAGETIATGAAEVQPLVRSGDQVIVLVRVGAVEAEGRGTASGSGHLGDVIRLVNPGLRKPVNARITGPGTVEIIQ